VIIADTSGLLAQFNQREPAHGRVVDAVASAGEPLVVSPYVMAELDYLVATRHGVDSELAVLDELAGGAYVLADFGPEDLGAARAVIARYADQEVGLADASLVVLAERYGTRSVLTLDRRHFEVLRPRQGGRFRILPG
jgi:predicted nucleic acid-binding protein